MINKNSEIQASNWTRTSDDSKVPNWSLSTGKLKLPGYYNITKRVIGPGDVTFWWKKTKYFDKIGTMLYVTIDGSVVGTYEDKTFDWVDQTPLDFGPGSHCIIWVFRILTPLPSNDAQGWIDEVKICENIENRTPSVIGLVPEKSSPQNVSDVIIWTATASDPENDPLLYKFLLNGSDKTGWTNQNTWGWRVTDQEVGNSKIEVQVRDGKHAGPEGFDDRRVAEFTILKPKITSLIFKVNSAKELKEAIDNNSNLEKLILIGSGMYVGSFYISNKQNITIKPNPEISGDVLINGSNNDYIFAIEDSSNISIKGITMLKGRNSILLEDSKDCAIISNTFKSFQVDGISLNNTSNTTVTGNDLESLDSKLNVSGIDLTNSNNNNIVDNTINTGAINGRSHEAILLSKSSNNLISFKGNGAIVEDGIECGVKCVNNQPVFCDHTDPDSNCQKLIDRKINNWSFQC